MSGEWWRVEVKVRVEDTISRGNPANKGLIWQY